MQYFACNLFSKQIVDYVELEPYTSKVGVQSWREFTSERTRTKKKGLNTAVLDNSETTHAIDCKLQLRIVSGECQISVQLKTPCLFISHALPSGRDNIYIYIHTYNRTLIKW
jgi:hypothetical protein